MPEKKWIAAELGETALLLPDAVTGALRANDRAKYYLTVFQAAREHALNPDRPLRELRPEREACDETDAALDAIASRCCLAFEGALAMPGAADLFERLVHSVERMLAPLREGGVVEVPHVSVYEQRLRMIIGQLPPIADDQVPAGFVEAVTRASRGEVDSLHLLIMDLHRELNRLHARLAEQVIDGATVYGLAAADSDSVRAFMRGINATRHLKFDHPGLTTTATRDAERLVIQNDLGTTDAHVIVIHVIGFTVSVTYTDVHKQRARFFKDLLAPGGIAWTDETGVDAAYATCVGRRVCAGVEQANDLLCLIGSRLVFLIDWNRARKRLGRVLPKTAAVAALKWAAEHEFGHRAFLEMGGEQLVYDALERTASAQLHWGATLNELLGRDAALAFAKSVLQITSEGVQQRQSIRLVRDEVQTELLEHLQESQQGLLALAGDHAALIVALAAQVRDVIVAWPGNGRSEPLQAAERAKRWESKADDLVNQARHLPRQGSDVALVADVLPVADDAADGLEDVTFLLRLLADQDDPDVNRQGVAAVAPLADICLRSTEEYVTCLELARDVWRRGTRADLQQFLMCVDRIVTLEHDSDAAEREATARLMSAASDFRALHLMTQVSAALEQTVDVLTRIALTLRDAAMADMRVP